MTNEDPTGGASSRPSDPDVSQPAYPAYLPPPYTQGHYAPTPPATSSFTRRSPRWPWIAGAALGAALIGAAVYGLTLGGLRHSEVEMATVTYEVTGAPGSVEVKYHDSDGYLSEAQVVTLPWRLQVHVPNGKRQLVSISANRTDSSNDSLACSITSQGKLIDEQRTAGPFAFCGDANFIGGAS